MSNRPLSPPRLIKRPELKVRPKLDAARVAPKRAAEPLGAIRVFGDPAPRKARPEPPVGQGHPQPMSARTRSSMRLASAVRRTGS
jgi:hypothetical protein